MEKREVDLLSFGSQAKLASQKPSNINLELECGLSVMPVSRVSVRYLTCQGASGGVLA